MRVCARMSLCMCVHAYVCMPCFYVCLCVFVFISVCVYMFISCLLCVCMPVCVHACVRACVCVRACMHVCVRMHACVCLYVNLMYMWRPPSCVGCGRGPVCEWRGSAGSVPHHSAALPLGQPLQQRIRTHCGRTQIPHGGTAHTTTLPLERRRPPMRHSD